MANSTLNHLYASAGNFLYIFVNHKQKGWQEIVKKKKFEQLAELSRLYQYDKGNHSMTDYVNVIRRGILHRYGKQPEQVLSELVKISNRTPGIGALNDAQAAQAIDNYSTPIKKNGKWYKDIGFWKDLANVLEKILNFFLKLFGKYRNPNIYRTSDKDWKGNQRPNFPQGKTTVENNTSQASIPILPIALLLGAYYYTQKKK